MTATDLQEIERQLLDIDAIKAECLRGRRRIDEQLARLEVIELPLLRLKAQLLGESV